MKYKEARAYRDTIEQRGMVLGLESMRRLLEQLGNPQDGLSVIHVAGTNGKGSVIAYLEEIMQRSGYRTGVYTSPAVYHPLEVFRADGRRMPEEVYGELMGRLKSALEALGEEQVFPTVYELETAMAFLYFVQEQCDIVLLETGLGGAMDATNCIRRAECIVLTSVGYDHMGVLGSTLGEIALQKAGIIKPGVAVVSAPQEQEVLDVFARVCEEKGARLTLVEPQEVQAAPLEGERAPARYELCYKDYRGVKLGLRGRFQAENAAIVLEVVEKLRKMGYNIPTECLMEGFASTQWKGRLTIVSEHPWIVLDGAHNVPAARQLARTLREDFTDRKWIFLMGVLEDKDYQGMTEVMAPLAEKIVTVTPPGVRALSQERLAEELGRRGYDACCGGSMQNALALGRNFCQGREDTGILVFGTFTVHAAFLEALQACMFRVERLMRHPRFVAMMDRLEELEQERRYCRHGWEHCMAVARAAALINEERGLGCQKELLYAMALIHDIGRVEQYEKGTAHEEAGARLAKELLPECGFDEGEVWEVLDAIRGHRGHGSPGNVLSQLLMEADKRTRMCFSCKVRESCKWQMERKNLTIHI